MADVLHYRGLQLRPSSFYEFSKENRFVTRIYKSEECEILVVCWNPGQKSSTHSHGDSESTVIVLEGKITVIVGGKEQVLQKQDITITPRGVPHQMINDASCQSVTLHIYAPSTKTPISEPFRDLSSQR
jgi:quercetin dioxygenase-like cupin family protein